MQRVRLRRTALRATPRMNTSTQPSEGAGGSRSKAAGELTLGLMSGEERVGVRRLAFLSWLASEGGLTADPSPAAVLNLLWELACQRWRPDSRPITRRCTRSTVGAGLPAMATCQPTHHLQMYPTYCGSWLASDGGLTADQSPADVPAQLWEQTCQRWRPDSQPITRRCTRLTVGAGLPADPSPAGLPDLLWTRACPGRRSDDNGPSAYTGNTGCSSRPDDHYLRSQAHDQQ